ncbi:MAG: hypothetical protein ACLRIS_16440 [Flavonifractor plautii]
MVEDDPDNQVFYGLMECLFDHHPIRVPIAGTQESISHITADTLYACHKAFYTLQHGAHRGGGRGAGRGGAHCPGNPAEGAGRAH